MRALVRWISIAGVLVLAGCGGDPAQSERVASARPAASATPDATDMNRNNTARELVYLYKINGDDPMPWQVTLRADDTAAVVFGGGHTGGIDRAVKLSPAQADRAQRLVAAVPWKRIADHTVEPGGFGGNDNMSRYMFRKGKISTTFADGDMPGSVARLVRMLDKIIDGDLGREIASDRHHSSNGGVLTDDAN